MNCFGNFYKEVIVVTLDNGVSWWSEGFSYPDVTWSAPADWGTCDIKDITIHPPVANGYRITVGCKEFVFTNQKDMFKAISEYYKDPAKAYKKYVRNK